MAKKGYIDYNKYEGITALRARELTRLSRITINDTAEIQSRVNTYLEYCDEQGRVPTVKGLCVNLGIDSRMFKSWIENNPEHETSKYLSIVCDLLADNIENGALKGELNNVTSIFLLKANHGYRENSEVVIKHEKSERLSMKELEEKIENEIIDAEFEEK